MEMDEPELKLGMCASVLTNELAPIEVLLSLLSGTLAGAGAAAPAATAAALLLGSVIVMRCLGRANAKDGDNDDELRLDGDDDGFSCAKPKLGRRWLMLDREPS